MLEFVRERHLEHERKLEEGSLFTVILPVK